MDRGGGGHLLDGLANESPQIDTNYNYIRGTKLIQFHSPCRAALGHLSLPRLSHFTMTAAQRDRRHNGPV